MERRSPRDMPAYNRKQNGASHDKGQVKLEMVARDRKKCQEHFFMGAANPKGEAQGGAE